MLVGKLFYYESTILLELALYCTFVFFNKQNRIETIQFWGDFQLYIFSLAIVDATNNEFWNQNSSNLTGFVYRCCGGCLNHNPFGDFQHTAVWNWEGGFHVCSCTCSVVVFSGCYWDLQSSEA